MRLLLTPALLLFMLALPPLIPAWTPSATLMVIVLEVLCAAVLSALWWTHHAEPALRVAAAIVAGIFLLAAIDQLRAAIQTRQPIVGGRTPLVGLFVIGLPCAWFAIRGLSPRMRADLMLDCAHADADSEHDDIDINNDFDEFDDDGDRLDDEDGPEVSPASERTR